MTSERNLGVTEARLGLSLLTCLLVALGYVVLQRLGDAESPPPTAASPSQPADSFTATAATPPIGSQDSQIVRTQGTEAVPAPYPHTSQRPLWLAPQQGDENALQPFDASAHDGNLGEPSLFEPQPIRASQVPGMTPRYQQ